MQDYNILEIPIHFKNLSTNILLYTSSNKTMIGFDTSAVAPPRSPVNPKD